MDVSIQHARLGNVPEEILEAICSRLGGKELLQMSYVNKRIRRHANFFLYRNINFTWTKSRTPGLIPLLLSVLKSNELAAHIRHLTMCGELTQVLSSFTTKKLLEPDELLLVSNFMPARCRQLLAEDPGHYWNPGPEKYSAAFFFALLLSKLGNLETLEMSANFLLFGNFIGDAFYDVYLAPCPDGLRANDYRRLRRVTFTPLLWARDSKYPSEYRYHSQGNGVRLEHVLPLFYLPAIETIELDHIDWPGAEWPREPPCASTLRCLIIKDPDIKGDGLEMVLKATPQLQYLRLDLEDGRMTRLRHYNTLPWQEFLRAISFVKDSIEHLTIGMRLYIRHGAYLLSREEDGDEVDPINSRDSLNLADFPRLTRMEILHDLRQWNLFRSNQNLANVLPRKVTHLIVRDDMYSLNYPEDWGNEYHFGSLHTALAEYLEDWRSSQPDLKMITVTVSDRDIAYKKAKCQETFDDFRLICDAAGVACVLDPDVMVNGI